MVIRVARVEDAPAMARVMVDTFLSAHRGQVPEEVWTKRKNEWTYEVSERGWARTLREMAEGKSPRECLFVAEDEAGEVVGLALGGPPRKEEVVNAGEVLILYVRESHQRRGIGRRLVQAVAAHLAGMGMTSLVIACLAANTPARRFYEALGGRVIAERECDEDGVMLPEVVHGWTNTQELIGAAMAAPE